MPTANAYAGKGRKGEDIGSENGMTKTVDEKRKGQGKTKERREEEGRNEGKSARVYVHKPSFIPRYHNRFCIPTA